MRRSAVDAVVTAPVIAATAVAVASGPHSATAAAADPCTWKNVRIDGGGSVPGIVLDPDEKDLVHARTDVGGASRGNRSAQSWTPLPDRAGQDDRGHHGVPSIAPDPVGTGRVHAAVGMHTNGRDPDNDAVPRSTGRGNTWSRTMPPFKAGSSMPGRGRGERLAVDPRDNRNVYFATEGGNGLWRGTDHGVTWGKVADFPNAGDYVADPADPNGHPNRNQGLTWVTFGPQSPAVHVGAAGEENPVHRSLGSGATGEPIAGRPTGHLAHTVAGRVARPDATTGVRTDILTGGQTVAPGRGGAATRAGAAVTVVNAGHHGTLAPGASTTLGLLGGTTGTTDPVPSPITRSTT
jgi:xyloglucan-specific exo-beta-1,4-glucanase